jgi:hypothetical protein
MRKRLPGYKIGFYFSHFRLKKGRPYQIQQFRDHEPEYGISQELKPFVVKTIGTGVFMIERFVGECILQQAPVLKRIA